jgi:hypothetical protein
VKESTLKEFEDIFRVVEVVKQNFIDTNPNLDRSLQIRRDMDKPLCIYQYIVAYRPVAKQWLHKQQPLLGNSRNIHAQQ